MRKMRAVLTVSSVALVVACSIVLVACGGASTVSIAEENGDDSFGSGVGASSDTSRGILDRSGIRAMGIAHFDHFDPDAANDQATPDSSAVDAGIPSTEDAGGPITEDAGSPITEDASSPIVTDAGGHGSSDAGSHSGTGGDGDSRRRRDRYQRRW